MSEQNERCPENCCEQNINHWKNANATDAFFHLILICHLIPFPGNGSLSSLTKCLETLQSYANVSILRGIMTLLQNFTHGVLTDFLRRSLPEKSFLTSSTPEPNPYEVYSRALASLNESIIDTSFENSFEIKFKFIVEGYCLLVFAFLGVIGIVSGICYILNKKRRSQFFNMMLLPLLIFDALYTFTEFVMSVEEHIFPFPEDYIWIYKYLLYPLRRVSMGASIFMTIALAHERLCSVNRPILQRNSFLSSKRRQHRRLAYVIPVTIAALFVNISAFWEIDIEAECYRDRFLANASGCFVSSALRNDANYSYYYVGLLRLLVLGIYPFVSLSYFNYKISQSIRFNPFRGTGVNVNQKGILRRRTVVEKRTTKVLVAIIMSFLVCHLPRVIINGMEFYIIQLLDSQLPIPVFVQLMSSIARLLLVLNASLNVGYYLYFTIFNKLLLTRYYRGSKSSVMLLKR